MRATVGGGMTDRVPPEARSRMMAAVKGKNTKPEMIVRQALHAAGYRFRLHRRDLPGRPDIVLPRYGTAVFVHGCFWHGHHCRRGRRPSTNIYFWGPKLDRNVQRDRVNQAALEAAGWQVVTIWECSLTDGTARLIEDLKTAPPPRST